MMIPTLDITLAARQAAPALLSPPLRGLLAACVCAAAAWAVGLALAAITAWERRHR